MKKDYRPKIHALFEEEKQKIKIEHEYDISRLQTLERMEQRLLQENSKELYIIDF